MTNEVVITLKGELSTDPWIVIHAEPSQLAQALGFITGDLMAQVHSTDQIFKAAKNVTSITPTPVGTVEVVQPPQGQAPAQPDTFQQPPVAPVPATAPVDGAMSDGLPPGVKVWQAPNPQKPQYQATFFQVPFIKEKDARDAFFKGLKDAVWAKPHDTTTKPWTYIAVKNGADVFVPNYMRQNAALFAAPY